MMVNAAAQQSGLCLTGSQVSSCDAHIDTLVLMYLGERNGVGVHRYRDSLQDVAMLSLN